MKKLLWVLAILLLALVPAVVAAHGGVEHNTEDAVVQLYQTPISPFVYERVESDFIFTDRHDERLKNMPVKLTLTDTFHGDESKDKVVLTQDLKTDANGILYFHYRYPKANAYDIDLDFEVNGKPQEAGFLLQTRNPLKSWFSLIYLAALGIGVGLGLLSRRWLYKPKATDLDEGNW